MNADVTLARDNKHDAAARAGIDDALIDRLVEGFYARIQADEALGPIFAARVANWAPHLARMKDFWASVAIEGGRFRGNPLLKHVAIREITSAHFERWLALWQTTLVDLAPTPEAEAFFQLRAERIANSLMLGISIHRDGILPAAQTKR